MVWQRLRAKTVVHGLKASKTFLIERLSVWIIRNIPSGPILIQWSRRAAGLAGDAGWMDERNGRVEEADGTGQAGETHGRHGQVVGTDRRAGC